MAKEDILRAGALFTVIVVLLVASVAVYSVTSSSVTTASSQTGSTGTICSQPGGVVRTQLGQPSRVGEVFTYQLPKPLRAPNSIVAAPDGSVWFGEVTLRGVAHLFMNGTLLEYSWPAAFVKGVYCADITQMWGLVLWHGSVWASDSVNDQLVGLHPSNDTFSTIALADGSMPRYLAVDQVGRLWFTESSTRPQVGMVASPGSAPVYFSVPAPAGEVTASLLFQNSSLAYVVAVSASTNAGQVYSFDPSSASPVFVQVGPGTALLAPYSVAPADGGLWVGQHDASELAFYNGSSHAWSYFPTSVNPDVELTLPYYLVANGSSVWFNEHDGNKIALLAGARTLTEYNVTGLSEAKYGVANELTLTLSKNLVWFTEWTGNRVGFVNASLPPPFTLSAPDALSLSPGSTTDFTLTLSGSSTADLSLLFSDSEYHTAIPASLTFSSNVTMLQGLSGTVHISVALSARAGMAPGEYLVLATVTDSLTYRSVYLTVTVT